jgi:hypothetical protein
MVPNKKILISVIGIMLIVGVAVVYYARYSSVRSSSSQGYLSMVMPGLPNKERAEGRSLTPDSFGISQPTAAGYVGSNIREERAVDAAYTTTRPPAPRSSVASR